MLLWGNISSRARQLRGGIFRTSGPTSGLMTGSQWSRRFPSISRNARLGEKPPSSFLASRLTMKAGKRSCFATRFTGKDVGLAMVETRKVSRTTGPAVKLPPSAAAPTMRTLQLGRCLAEVGQPLLRCVKLIRWEHIPKPSVHDQSKGYRLARL